MMLSQYLIPDWWKGYSKQLFRSDLMAGLTVGITLIPQGMAYAELAGIPPIYGLYTALFPVLVYGWIGSNQKYAVGPAGLTCMIAATALVKVAEEGTDEYILYAGWLAILVGIIYFLLKIFQLGKLVKYLTPPISRGFAAGGGLLILISQIPHVLGVHYEKKGNAFQRIGSIAEHIAQTHGFTLLVGAIGVLLIWAVPKWKKTLPIAFILIVISTLITGQLAWDERGIQILQDIPKGLPAFGLSTKVELIKILQLVPEALMIALFGYAVNMTVGRIFGEEDVAYTYSPQREFVAMGVSNIVAGLTGGFMVNGALSRTMVNDQAGAKTGLATVLSGVFILFTLLFFTPYFYYLPKAILAAIIIVSVFKLISPAIPMGFYKTSKWDFAVYIVTLMGVLLTTITYGVAIGIVFSLLKPLFIKRKG